MRVTLSNGIGIAGPVNKIPLRYLRMIAEDYAALQRQTPATMKAKIEANFASFHQLMDRCSPHSRDAATICRCFKELCILKQDFDEAAIYRDLQFEHCPPKAKKARAA